MAEKKHTIISASNGQTTTRRVGVAEAQLSRSTTGLRIGAILLWVAAFVAEFFAVKAILSPVDDPFIPSLSPLVAGIIFLVVDAILVLVGSLLWKKANHIHPASEKKPVLFWLYNNLGVIAVVLAFAPFIIILLSNKKVDKRTKLIGVIVAAVALLATGLGSYDWNPYSQEEQQEMLQLEQATENVYWTKGGSVYHIYEDCQHLDRSDSLFLGTATEAEAAGKQRLCKTCLRRHQTEVEAAQTVNENTLEEVVETVTETAESFSADEVTE
ncbi:MAG: hypothetical protein MJZ82_00225 [Paludibacteraceae bacterium]|nr:hypothetical protein [Paludibacteraceae bacterium]